MTSAAEVTGRESQGCRFRRRGFHHCKLVNQASAPRPKPARAVGANRTAIRAIAALTIVVFGIAAPSQAQDTDEREQAIVMLQERGLTQAGKVWVTEPEARLRELLAGIRRKDADHRKTAREFDRDLQANNRSLGLVNQAKAEAEELGRRIDAGNLTVDQTNRLTLEHNRRVAFVNELGPKVFDADSKVNNIPLAQTQTKRMDLRSGLIQDLLEIDRLAEQIVPSYEGLPDDAEIAAMMETAMPGSKLGPAKSYEPDIRQLTRVRNSVFSGEIPVNRQGADYRITAVINEQRGATFTFDAESPRNLLSAAVVDDLQLEVDADAPHEEIVLPDERAVSARRQVISTVRLGDVVLSDVEFYVLDADASDVGSILAESVFSRVNFEFQPQLLHLTVKAKEDAAADR